MGLNNPLPSSLASECKKCGKILQSFIDPRQALSPDKVIPPEILQNAKGLAILTVIKAGFLGSARFGSGLVVARLDSGGWSAPTAIMTGGAGFGGQIGFEITDFVFILNDKNAVKTFSQAGSITLGGNVSIAAGPVGRNAEAAGAASLKSVAGIFSYSKTKGLFAGVSLEGSAIIERKDANEKLYGQRYTAMQLLSGSIQAPPESRPLMSILDGPAFRRGGTPATATATADDDLYNSSVYGGDNNYNGSTQDNFGAPQRASTWQAPPSNSWAQPTSPTGGAGAGAAGTERRAGPGRPAAPKPNFVGNQNPPKNQAVAVYTFESDTPGDLTFKKGEVITIIQRTENETDWWTGMIGTRRGIFPSNYVKMQ